MKTMKYVMIGFFAFILGVIFTRYVISNRCYYNLERCSRLLDDPHHCISVVIDYLEKNQ